MVPSMRVIAALLFGSGFSALVYQTVWQRTFRLTFGASTLASAAVLAIFLGGLGVGGALLGKRVERSTRPLAFYGNLELGISVLAALSPLFADLTHRCYVAIGGVQTLGSVGATAVRLLLTTLVIGPAAVLMGGTLPAAARAVVSEADETRRSLALLYSLNTVGAVLGALVGPLALFGLLGNRLTLWSAVCINLLVAMAARALGRAAPEVVATPAESKESGATSVAPEVRLAYVAAGLVGFAFLGLELVWYRMLSPMLGGSTLTFGLILACALAGIGVGGYLFARRPATRPVTLQTLAITLTLEAVCVLVPFAWGDGLTLLAAYLRPMASLGFGYLLSGWLFVACIVVLPASVVSGYQFPALFALIGRGRAEVGRQVGRAYAFNTVGTLSGSLLVGLVLLPGLGAVTLWRSLGLALALFGAGCAIYAVVRGAKRGSAVLAGVLSLVAVLLAMAVGPGPFRHAPVGAGRVSVATLSPNRIIQIQRDQAANIAWSRDGIESAVAIDVTDGISFRINGKSDGSIVGDRGTQAFLGLLPAALHGQAKTAFVVGLGTGMTPGLLARVPSVERVDVAELEPSVTEVARYAAGVNEHALDNPKLRVLVGDGRELLLTSPHRYDLIISEPSNPFRAGVAALFTVEFYEAVASRLQSRGLFAQWLQGYEIDAQGIAIALHTMRAVFPHVSVWGPQRGDFILLGSFEPQVVDVDRLRGELQQPHYLKWLRRAWLAEGVEAMLAHSLAPEPTLPRLLEGLPADVNTDDLNLLELAFNRGLEVTFSASQDLVKTLGGTVYRPAVKGDVDWDRVEQLRIRFWGGLPGAKPAPKTQAVIAGCSGSMETARRWWPEGVEPIDVVEVWVKGYVDALSGADTASGYAERLLAQGFAAESVLIRARVAEARKDSAGASALLAQAFDELRRQPLPLCDTVERALERADALARQYPQRAGDLARALGRGRFAAYQQERRRQLTQLSVASRSPDPKVCVATMGVLRHSPAWERPLLASRALCLARAGEPDASSAAADYAAFIAEEPVTFSLDPSGAP